MKFLIISLLIFPWTVYSQGLSVSADSSGVLFPNQVKISINKTNLNGRTYFQLDRKAFKALVLTTNQYLQQNSISVDNVELLTKNQSLLDSSFQLVEKKLVTEKERTILYQHAYEDLKQVSATYNQQLIRCTQDLTELKNEKGRSKTRSFITGFFVGGTMLSLILVVVSSGN